MNLCEALVIIPSVNKHDDLKTQSNLPLHAVMTYGS